MKNEALVTAKDIFDAIKAEYIRGEWFEFSNTEIHKKLVLDKVVMLRVDGPYIDMRMSGTSNFTARHITPHHDHVLTKCVNEFKQQFAIFEREWVDDLIGTQTI